MGRNFALNEFYHIFDRGVEKRSIFVDKNDYIRFIHDLYEFNDQKPAPEFTRRNIGNVGRATSHIINLHTFALMPNHHHLLVEPIQENGIYLFMKKLHSGYARSFNEKHKRSGYLFQGRYKDVHVRDDKQFAHLICYIHSNPLNLWRNNWKEKKLTKSEINEALKFLEKYRWSSHLDYLGIKNFPSVINKKFLLEFFDGANGYKKFFINWLEQYRENEEIIHELILE